MMKRNPSFRRVKVTKGGLMTPTVVGQCYIKIEKKINISLCWTVKLLHMERPTHQNRKFRNTLCFQQRTQVSSGTSAQALPLNVHTLTCTAQKISWGETDRYEASVKRKGQKKTTEAFPNTDQEFLFSFFKTIKTKSWVLSKNWTTKEVCIFFSLPKFKQHWKIRLCKGCIEINYPHLNTVQFSYTVFAFTWS